MPETSSTYLAYKLMNDGDIMSIQKYLLAILLSVTIVASASPTTATYDATSRLQTFTSCGETSTYSYDNLGNITSLTRTSATPKLVNNGSSASIIFSYEESACIAFDGTAGQILGLGMFASLLTSPPNSSIGCQGPCPPTFFQGRMIAPSGAVFANVVASTDGSGANLPALVETGVYQLIFNPTMIGISPVGATVALTLSTDIVGTINIGSSTPFNLARYGQNAYYTFAGTVGQQVVISFPTLISTGTSLASTLRVIAPNGTLLTTIPVGPNAVSSTLLPAFTQTGIYRLELDVNPSASSLSGTLSLVLGLPDLTVSNLMIGTITSNANAEYSIPIAYSVNNSGNGLAKATWNDNCYLSTDANLDVNDRLIGSQSRSIDLAPGGSYFVSMTCLTNNTALGGAQSLFVKADGGGNVGFYAATDSVGESNEANNVMSANVMLPFITYAVTPSVGANGVISPSSTLLVNRGTTTIFTVTPNVGYRTSISGSCGGTLVGNTYTTNPVFSHCNVDASFTLITYNVTPSAGANGTISPNTLQTIGHGSTTSFTVTPNVGYVAAVGGTCGGTLVGNSFTTNNILGNCTVNTTFSLKQLSVITSTGANGTISPASTQIVNYGSTATFVVTPNAGYTASLGGTCGGALVGNSYTTSIIIADCTVNVTFGLITYSVTPTTGSNGSISPSTVQNVASGATTSFAVIPNSGYAASVGGTCGGTLVSNTFTINPVSADCTVNASFALATTAPDAPTIDIAIPSNNQAIIKFTPPANNGGSPITNYTVTCNSGSISATGVVSPITITGLVNDQSYTCSVTATNAVGTSLASTVVNVTPTSATLLVTVQSRKTHGAAGTFDLPINTNETIGGLVTVEPRNIGSGHSIVFQFNQVVTQLGTLSLVDTQGASIGIAAAMINPDANNEVIVMITDMPNANRITISLNGVNATLNASASMGFLIGDVNNTRVVTNSDLSGVKTRTGMNVDATNFMYDVNSTGSITSTDISTVKVYVGTQLN
jgi:Fibronectin type III domain/Divergent InlB B-repeat domain